MATSSAEGKVKDETGQPLVIFRKESGKFRLQDENMKKILCRDDVKDHPVMILSIAGALREGKSFILNFIMRYLRSSQADDWLGEESSALDGFSWKGGAAANTMGILMWSEPFHIDTHYGKVAVILMDTQGLFDEESLMDEVKTIFCMSFLLCSFQVYNVMRQIKDDMMQCFTTFLEYAKMAESSGEHEFLLQRLLFLIRDWPNEATHGYGACGGEKYIQEYINSSKSFASASSRSNLKNAAEQIQCFLLPSPGRRVCETRRNQAPFVGALKEIDETFLATLPELMDSFFCAGNIVPKILNGQILTGKVVMAYAKSLDELFCKDELPKAEDITTSIKLASYGALKEEFLKRFREEMDKVCGVGAMDEDGFLAKGEEIFTNLLAEYNKRPKYDEDENQMQEEIHRILKIELEVCVQNNRNKIEAMRKHFKALAIKQCESNEMQLRKTFDGVCVMPRDLEDFCDGIAITSSRIFPEVIQNSGLEDHFSLLVLIEMDRVKQRMLNKNDAKLRDQEAICSKMKLECERLAEEQMEEVLQADVLGNREIARNKGEIKAAISRNWNIFVKDQNGPKEVLNKHKRLLLESVDEILRHFEKKNDLNKDRLDKEASQEVDIMCERFKMLMAKEMGRTSRERKDVEMLHAKVRDAVEKSTKLWTLKSYTEKRAKQSWNHQVKSESDKIFKQNSANEQVERRHCEVIKANCIKRAESLLEEECRNRFFNDKELDDRTKKIRQQIIQKFNIDCPTHRPSILAKPLKDLEDYFEHQFNKHARERNQENVNFLEEEVEALLHKMKIESGRIFAERLTGKEPDMRRATEVANIVQSELLKILQKHTEPARLRCRNIVRVIIDSELEKYEKRRHQLKKEKEERIKDLIAECLSTYRRLMKQYMLGSKIGSCHNKALIEVETILYRSQYSEEEHVCDRVHIGIKSAKDKLLENERLQEKKIANDKQRLIKLYRSNMENNLRGACCSEPLLKQYESEALRSVEEHRRQFNIDLPISTEEILESEKREIRRKNEAGNEIFERRCLEYVAIMIDDYKATPRRERERIARDRDERKKDVEGRIGYFRRWIGEGNLDTISVHIDLLERGMAEQYRQ